MKTQKRWMVAIVLLTLASAGAVEGAYAGTPPPPEDAPAKTGGRDKMLRERVGLDTAKVKTVAAVLEAQKVARKPVRAEIKAAFQALRDLVKGDKADDPAYNAAIAKVQAARERLHALEAQQHAELAKLLTPREHARYLLATRKLKKHGKDDGAKPKVSPKAPPPATTPAKDDDEEDGSE